jgi:hypothetical protein
MDQRLRMQPLGDVSELEDIDRALLEHAGADAAQHMFRRVPFEKDGIDACPVQQLTE